MPVQVPSPVAAGADGRTAIVSFSVHGLSEQYLHAYLEEIHTLRHGRGAPAAAGRHRYSHKHGGCRGDQQQQPQAIGSPAALATGNGGSPTAPVAPGATRPGRGETLHEVRSVDELSFAVLSDHDALGAWGRAFPILLVPSSTPTSGAAGEAGETVYTGQASLPLRVLEMYGREGVDAESPLPPLTCRLVIVKASLIRNPPPAVQACPGASILAVDNAHTYPRPVQLRSLKLPAKVDLASAAALTDSNKLEMLLQGHEAWEAVVDVSAQGVSDARPHPKSESLPKVRFSPAESQFLFLRTLARESPSAVKQRSLEPHRPDPVGLRAEDDDAAASANPVPQRGPLLSLAFFGNDPRKNYHRPEWLAALPPTLQAAVAQEDEAISKAPGGGPEGSGGADEAAVLRTVPFNVTRVRPVPMEGSCWCETALPTPAPMKKQMEAVKREQQERTSKAASTAAQSSPPKAPSQPPTSAAHRASSTMRPSTASSMTSCFGSDDADGDELADEVKGWCVRPLWHARPVTGKGMDANRTQDWWNCVVDLSRLENQALEVEVEVPFSLLPAALRQAGSPTLPSPATGDGGGRVGFSKAAVRGSTVLVSSMFHQGTKGVMQTSIPCRLPVCSPRSAVAVSGGAVPSYVWVFLHVHFLFTFPYHHDDNDLRVVRSVESYDRLTVPTLVGHRGLGKTYTRRGAKPGQPPMSKLAENSIESLNAAHQRGCEMVEFDVMLTRDRIPVIFHDPVLVLHAEEKTVEARLGVGGGGRDVDGDGDGEGDADGETARETAATTTMLTQLQRWYLQRQRSFVPIPVAIHSLTKRQLDALVTESFSFGGRDPPRLKLLALRHWPQILRIYRNRSRLQYMRTHNMPLRLVDRDEFRGCGSRPAVGGLTSPLAAPRPARYDDPMEGMVSTVGLYESQLRHRSRVLERQEDITNRIPAFYELFLLTPPSLSLNIEVKYPFMPLWDANLFQQADAFEVNGFVDAVLDVVFAYADEGREVAFSSFEPDICLALAAKQSRYDVLFLCDTEEKVDLKDYRSFHLEGAIQFAHAGRLAGVSINAATLPFARRGRHEPPTPPTRLAAAPAPTSATRDSMELFNTEKNITTNSRGERTVGRIPLVRELVRRKVGGACIGPSDESDMRQWCDWQAGKDMVAAAHARGLKVWTWGDNNSDLLFAYVQGVYMGVDAIITDNVPV